MSKPTTGKYSYKKYRCTRCGLIKSFGTNHWGSVYPRCPGCSWKNPLDPYSVWICLEKRPRVYDLPSPWEKIQIAIGIAGRR